MSLPNEKSISLTKILPHCPNHLAWLLLKKHFVRASKFNLSEQEAQSFITSSLWLQYVVGRLTKCRRMLVPGWRLLARAAWARKQLTTLCTMLIRRSGAQLRRRQCAHTIYDIAGFEYHKQLSRRRAYVLLVSGKVLTV